MDEKIILDKKIVEDVLEYLQTKPLPLKETFPLVNALQQSAAKNAEEQRKMAAEKSE